MSNPISDDCSSGLHEYCTPCDCECHNDAFTDTIMAWLHSDVSTLIIMTKELGMITLEKTHVDPSTDIH